MQNTTSTRTLWISIMILAAELTVIAAAVYTIFTQMPDTKMQYTSVSLFITVSVGLRMVKPISTNKLFRYAIASVVTLVFVLFIRFI